MATTAENTGSAAFTIMAKETAPADCANTENECAAAAQRPTCESGSDGRREIVRHQSIRARSKVVEGFNQEAGEGVRSGSGKAGQTGRARAGKATGR